MRPGGVVAFHEMEHAGEYPGASLRSV
jgi:hypothetical protein